MGNKESSASSLSSPTNRSTRHLEIDTNGPWLCGTCGIVNDVEATKCKVCQTDAPQTSSSPTDAKRGTFFRSTSGKAKKSEAMSPKPPGVRALHPHDKKKSEIKIASTIRMRTLVVHTEENHALIFIKPSVPKIDAVREHIEEHFEHFKCHLTSEGTVTADEIASRGIIDKHYSALSKNAMDLNPPKRILSETTLADFKEAFKIDYSDEKVLTLGQFLKIAPHVSAKDIDAAWNAGKRVKFGGGLYVGRLELLEKDHNAAPSHRPLLVVNGFYAAMRADYLTKGSQVLYFTVEWKEKDLSWKDFRALAVGATDPTKAHPKSLRGKMLAHWKELGLKEAPSIQNNCVHASAGPIEAMKERATWIGMPLEEDPFAQAMLNEGIPMDLIRSWSDNGLVKLEDKTAPAFDFFEDMDSGKVIRTALRIVLGSSPESAVATTRKKPAGSTISDHVVEVTGNDDPMAFPRAKGLSTILSDREG